MTHKRITTCYINWRGVKMPLQAISVLEMADLRKHWGDIEGFPQTFDSKGRIWPKPSKDLKVVIE